MSMNTLKKNTKKLSMYMAPVVTKALGPYKRYAIWVQGCEKNCQGCIATDARSLNEGMVVTVSELVETIVKEREIEGITISGGEPFLQQEALCELIDSIRVRRDCGVIIYTGMSYKEISDTTLAQKSDLVIDGEYIAELNDDKSLRGSSNQNIIDVSGRYKECIEEYYGQTGRRVEVIAQGKRLRLVGIPSKKVSSVIELKREG